MKRDMDLVRSILFKLEEGKAGEREWLEDGVIEGYSAREIWYHVKIMDQAGLVTTTRFGLYSVDMWVPIDLTWNGHEFLDAARNPNLWERAKHTALKQTGGLSLEVLQEVLINLAKQAVGT